MQRIAGIARAKRNDTHPGDALHLGYFSLLSFYTMCRSITATIFGHLRKPVPV